MRYKYIKHILFSGLFVLVFCSMPGFCEETALTPTAKPLTLRKSEEHKSERNLGTWLSSVYGTYVSSVDGDRCPSIPSCSTYSRMAFKKHGFFIGWMMTVDRLLHEADEGSVSPIIYDGGRSKVLDPVENNDFWWFRKHEPKGQ